MDRSFVVEAQSYGNLKDVVAVIFLNSEPGKPFLSDLGLDGIKSVAEVRPLSKQPTEPTMYVFQPNTELISVTRFGWDGKAINSQAVHGQPADLIPPVSGKAADSLLYVPSAFIISGSIREGSSARHVVGVLVCKNGPGKKLRPDKKTLNRLGFHMINSVDSAGPVPDAESSALFLFDRSPSPLSVTVIGLDCSGERVSETVQKREPHEVVPKVSGPAAEKYIYGALMKPGDFPKKDSVPPSGGNGARKRLL